MTTTNQAANDLEGDGRPVPERQSERSYTSGQSVPSVDSTFADHPSVADGILNRLDEMDSRVEQLAAAQDGHQPGGADSAILAQLQAEISSGTNTLALQLNDAVIQQNQAIAGIALALSGLQDCFTRSFAEFAARAPDEDPSASPSGNHEYTQPEANGDAVEPNEPIETNEPNVTSMSAWDDIKSAFLTEESSGCTDDNAGRSNDHESSETSNLSQPDENTEPVEVSAPDEPFEIPELLDIDGLSDAELRPAIIDRESLMSTLVQRLLRKVRSEQTLSPEQLKDIKDGLPEELADKVERSLETLHQQERVGQLDLCLERARISRQLSTLEDTREKLEASARGMGMTISDDGLLEGRLDASQKRGSKGRRWLTVMGFGN